MNVDLFTASNAGKPRTQVLNLQQQIENLAQHIRNNPNDWHAFRALERALAKRRNMLEYVGQEK